MCKLHLIHYICGHIKRLETAPCHINRPNSPASIKALTKAQIVQRAPRPTQKAPTNFLRNSFIATKLQDQLNQHFVYSADGLVSLCTTVPDGETFACSPEEFEAVVHVPVFARGAHMRFICKACRDGAEWWGKGMTIYEMEVLLEANGWFVPGEQEDPEEFTMGAKRKGRGNGKGTERSHK